MLKRTKFTLQSASLSLIFITTCQVFLLPRHADESEVRTKQFKPMNLRIGRWVTSQGSLVQVHYIAPWLAQPFTLRRLIKWVLGTPANFVFESKLSPCSCSPPLRQANFIYKKKPSSSIFLPVIWLSNIYLRFKELLLHKFLRLKKSIFVFFLFSRCCSITKTLFMKDQCLKLLWNLYLNIFLMFLFTQKTKKL